MWLKTELKIFVIVKVASAGGARLRCGGADFGPPADATAR
jgi:hypothetical protein